MKALARLNKYFFRYRGHLVLGILFVVLQNFGAIYPAQVVRESLDQVINHLKNNPLSGSSDYITALVFRFFLLIIGVAFLTGVLMFLNRQKNILNSPQI